MFQGEVSSRWPVCEQVLKGRKKSISTLNRDIEIVVRAGGKVSFEPAFPGPCGAGSVLQP